ncbi:MAG: hypothetical protein ACREB8_00090 [Pseudolabrys sp.]
MSAFGAPAWPENRLGSLEHYSGLPLVVMRNAHLRREAGKQMITEGGNIAIEDLHSAVSWKAILAGTVAAAAITLLLVAFGVGVGLSVVSPWSDQGMSSTSFTIAAGIYLIVVAMIPSTIGGYLAGRLRSKWQTVHEHERNFRDTAHGLVVWALATLVTVAFLSGPLTHLIAGAGLAASSAASAAMQSSPADVYVDGLLRTDPGQRPQAATAAPQAPSPTTEGQNAAPPQSGQTASSGPANRGNVNRAAITRILAPAMLKGGAVSDPDKAYLAKIVSARTGVSQADAAQRVNQIITQAKSVADAARKSAAKFALWLVAAMLAGALSASLAAMEGGSLRNREWYLTAK